MRNLNYCKPETRAKIQSVLENPAVHEFTKRILREGLEKDALDAYWDAKLAADLLDKVAYDILQKMGGGS